VSAARATYPIEQVILDHEPDDLVATVVSDASRTGQFAFTFFEMASESIPSGIHQILPCDSVYRGSQVSIGFSYSFFPRMAQGARSTRIQCFCILSSMLQPPLFMTVCRNIAKPRCEANAWVRRSVSQHTAGDWRPSSWRLPPSEQ